MESKQKVLVMRNLVSLLTFALMIVLLGCSKSPVGVYKEEGSDRIIELKPDGTFQASGGIPFLNGVKNGRYKVSDDMLLFEWDRNGKKEGWGTPLGGSFFRLSDNLSEPSPHPYPTMTFIKQTRDSSSTASRETPSDAGKLTNAKAQRALDAWMSGKGGSVSVVGIQDLPQENSARVDLKISNLRFTISTPYMNLPKDCSSCPGVALFSHYNDGRWILKSVETMGGENQSGRWSDLNIEAQ